MVIEKENAVVVIPIYKRNLNDDERMSLIQCFKILKKHTVCLVCPSELKMDLYEDIAEEHSVRLTIERFPETFFEGIVGYNELMMTLCFYSRFQKYEYILIYQLDAWVFRDELDEWCQKGYDYIGAPWFKNYGTHEDGYNLCAVGNGGFSLRKVKYFVDLLSYRGPLKSCKTLNLKPSLKNILYKILYSVGYQNNVKYYRRDPTLFEDVFFSLFLSNTRFQPKVPDVETASLFSFEKSPSFLFSNTNKLPFGCHGWKKYEYDIFWSRYIK